MEFENLEETGVQSRDWGLLFLEINYVGFFRIQPETLVIRPDSAMMSRTSCRSLWALMAGILIRFFVMTKYCRII